jgi:hypothetical protein
MIRDAMARRRVRLLGFAPVHLAGLLIARLGAIPGPSMACIEAGDIAVLLQAEPAGRLSARRRQALKAGLLTLQRRLETACQIGPFLPMDPGAACAPAHQVRALLEAAEADVSAALAMHGGLHQWDLALSWPAEPVVAQRRAQIVRAAEGNGPAGLAEAVASALRAERERRAACLLGALRQAALTCDADALSGGDNGLTVTILLPAGPPSAIEATLLGLPEWMQDCTADLRGPLPPLHFAAIRLDALSPSAIAASWRCLDAPASLDAQGLHRLWRRHATICHPDHAGPASASAFAALGAAYRTLRPLLPPGSGAYTLDDLQALAGLRLVAPHATGAAPPHAAEPPAVLEEAL